MALCRCDNILRRDHHAKVNNLKAVAAKNNRRNVLSNVVNIALNSCHEIFSSALCALRLLDIWLQNCHRTLHRTGCFYDLRKEHFTLTKELSNTHHTRHKWLFDNRRSRRIALQCLFNILLKETLIATLKGSCKALIKRDFGAIFLLFMLHCA